MTPPRRRQSIRVVLTRIQPTISTDPETIPASPSTHLHGASAQNQSGPGCDQPYLENAPSSGVSVVAMSPTRRAATAWSCNGNQSTPSQWIATIA